MVVPLPRNATPSRAGTAASEGPPRKRRGQRSARLNWLRPVQHSRALPRALVRRLSVTELSVWPTSVPEVNNIAEALREQAADIQRQGIAPGTRVAFMVPPSLEFFALFFALFKAGCLPVLIDPGIGLKPLKSCLGEARPEVFIGVTRAQIARMVLGWARGHIKRVITVGPRPFALGMRYRDLLTENATDC